MSIIFTYFPSLIMKGGINKRSLSLILLLFFLLNIHATAQIEKIDTSKCHVLRIDPEMAKGGSVSDIFDEVEFIPLETTKESQFGQITQLSILNGHYIIFDSDTKAVLIFLLNGKYVNKIKIEKKENNELDVWGFKIAKNADQDAIEIFTGKHLILFDLTGKLIKKTTISKPYIYHQYALPDSTIVNLNYQVNSMDSAIYEVALMRHDKIKTKYFPFTRQQRKNDTFISGGRPVYTSENNNELHLIRYYDYKIYKISSEGLSLAYQAIFPERNSIPIDFMTNPGYNKKRLQFFEKNKEVFFGISNLYKCGDNLFINLDNRQYDFNKNTELVYNLKTNGLTSIKDLLPDSKSYYLPVTDAGLGEEFQKTGFNLYRDGFLYTSYSSSTIFRFKEQNSDKQIEYSKFLVDFFNVGNKESNPVLIKLKPKTK